MAQHRCCANERQVAEDREGDSQAETGRQAEGSGHQVDRDPGRCVVDRRPHRPPRIRSLRHSVSRQHRTEPDLPIRQRPRDDDRRVDGGPDVRCRGGSVRGGRRRSGPHSRIRPGRIHAGSRGRQAQVLPHQPEEGPPALQALGRRLGSLPHDPEARPPGRLHLRPDRKRREGARRHVQPRQGTHRDERDGLERSRPLGAPGGPDRWHRLRLQPLAHESRT